MVILTRSILLFLVASLSILFRWPIVSPQSVTFPRLPIAKQRIRRLHWLQSQASDTARESALFGNGDN